MNTQVRLTVYLPRVTARRVKYKALELDRSISSVVYQALTEFLRPNYMKGHAKEVGDGRKE